MVFGPGDHEPPRTVSRDPVGLRETVEGQAEQIGGEPRGGNVLRAVEEDPVIDLVGEEKQVVLTRDLDHPLQHLTRVDRARGIVRIDDDDGLGPRRDLGPDVLEVRVPPVLLVAEVVHRGPPGEARHRGPERIVRCRDQHLVALVEECLHGHGDELGHTVAEEDVVRIECG
ncbi:hypothetical protein ABE10_02985, partial [Bacillus toyonensis]|nr:hypothetical protein [Bacillus toyonensis]